MRKHIETHGNIKGRSIYICFECLDLYSKCLDLSLGVWTCLRVFGPGPGPGPGRAQGQAQDQAGPRTRIRPGPGPGPGLGPGPGPGPSLSTADLKKSAS